MQKSSRGCELESANMIYMFAKYIYTENRIQVVFAVSVVAHLIVSMETLSRTFCKVGIFILMKLTRYEPFNLGRQLHVPGSQRQAVFSLLAHHTNFKVCERQCYVPLT